MKKPQKNVIILTGPSASGKSGLARALAQKGFAHIDADKVAHGLYAKGKPLWKALIAEFGRDIVGRSGRIDRKRLGALVFGNARRFRALKKLAYPALNAELRRRLAGMKRAVVDMPVYFDAGAPKLGGRVVLVSAPLALRVKRLRAKGLDAKRARARAASLKFGAGEMRRADLILSNAGSKAALRRAFFEWHSQQSHDASNP